MKCHLIFEVKLSGTFFLAQSVPLYHKVHLHNIQEMYEHLVLAELLLNLEGKYSWPDISLVPK